MFPFCSKIVAKEPNHCPQYAARSYTARRQAAHLTSVAFPSGSQAKRGKHCLQAQQWGQSGTRLPRDARPAPCGAGRRDAALPLYGKTGRFVFFGRSELRPSEAARTAGGRPPKSHSSSGSFQGWCQPRRSTLFETRLASPAFRVEGPLCAIPNWPEDRARLDCANVFWRNYRH